MRITRRKLKMIIESYLFEGKKDPDCLDGEDGKQSTGAPYICPRCGHVHKGAEADKLTDSNHEDYTGKCVGCSLKYGKCHNNYKWGTAPKDQIDKGAQKQNEVQYKMLQEKRKRRRKKKKRGGSKETQCPTATTDISVNTANRDRARKLDWIMYGPLNVEFPGKYWKKIAEKWGTSPKAAKKSNCGNCVAFDRSPKMVDDCIPAITSEPVADEFGVLGYCWMHHFKCHSARTCNTWAAGGPIQTDESSGEWFDRNKEGALKKEPIDPELYKDDSG